MQEKITAQTMELSVRENSAKPAVTNSVVKRIIFTHGLPSSGKSTLARKIKEEVESQGLTAVILETDDFFMVDGEYRFDYNSLAAAHRWNRERFAQAILDRVNLIIIANTNLTWREIKPYCLTGYVNGYHLEVIEPDTPWKEDVEQLIKLSKQNHNVPREAYERMIKKRQSVEYLREKINSLEDNYEW